MIFLNVLSYIQSISSFVLLLIFLFNYSSTDGNFKLIGALAGISTIANILQESVPRFLNGAYLNQIGEAYQLLSVFVISLFFLKLNNTKFARILFYVLNVTCFVLWVLLLVYLNDHVLFSVYSVISYIGLNVFAILYFGYLLKYLPSDNLLTVPEFWVASAVLFNFSGYLIITLSYGYLVEVLKENTILYWSLFNVFTIIFYALISYSMVLHVKNIKATSRERL
ncbi:MAG: hypothetical protein ACOVOF_06615 [Chryseotalea sp.]|jgi:hypothetical protein|nr:hypothetical protein [Flammeovirgaceae bacterium]